MRLLRGKLSELAQVVWRARVSPSIVRLADPLLQRQQAESKEKEDAENNDGANAPAAATSKQPSTSCKTASPFQQYISQRCKVVQLQQCCDKLGQRINALADQHHFQTV